MPIRCPEGKYGFSCEGCSNLFQEIFCWRPPRLPKSQVSIYEILTENERVCALEEKMDWLIKTLNEAPLPPPYQELLNRIEQTQGLTEHLHQHYHLKEKTKDEPF